MNSFTNGIACAASFRLCKAAGRSLRVSPAFSMISSGMNIDGDSGDAKEEDVEDVADGETKPLIAAIFGLLIGLPSSRTRDLLTVKLFSSNDLTSGWDKVSTIVDTKRMPDGRSWITEVTFSLVNKGDKYLTSL